MRKKIKEFILCYGIQIAGILFLIYTLCVNNELIDTVMLIVACIFFLFFLIFIIYHFIKSHKNRKKLKLINADEIDKVRTYYDRKVFTLLNENTDEIELYDDFETMWDVCRFFLKMDKFLGYKRSEIFVEENIELIKKINSKNLNNIYKETKKILDIIYTYYDQDGNRKI